MSTVGRWMEKNGSALYGADLCQPRRSHTPSRHAYFSACQFNARHVNDINATATNSLPNGTEIPVLGYSAVAETYATWKARNFPSNSVAGEPDGDPDGDGRPNLPEFAVGSNPNAGQDPPYLDLAFGAARFTIPGYRIAHS